MNQGSEPPADPLDDPEAASPAGINCNGADPPVESVDIPPSKSRLEVLLARFRLIDLGVLGRTLALPQRKLSTAFYKRYCACL